VRALICVVAFSVVAVAQETVYQPKDGVVLPRVVREVKAAYTQEARDAHLEGTVFVRAVVKSDGTVGDVSVERSLDPTYGLDQAAVDATKAWLFKPGTKDGKPVAVSVGIEHTFKLK